MFMFNLKLVKFGTIKNTVALWEKRYTVVVWYNAESYLYICLYTNIYICVCI